MKRTLLRLLTVGAALVLAAAGIVQVTSHLDDGSTPALSQGMQIDISPYIPVTLVDFGVPGRVFVCTERAVGSEYDAYLLDYNLGSEQLLASLSLDPLSVLGNRGNPNVSQNGTYFYTATSSNGMETPGRLLRYNITNLQLPVLDRDYFDPVDPFGECMYYTSRAKLFGDPDKVLIRSPEGRTHTPAIVNLANGQILGQYDRQEKFFAIAEHPNGNLIVLTSRRYCIDTQPNVNQNSGAESREADRWGPDLVELSPTLQFIRIIGENNEVEGKYEAEMYPPITMQLVNNGNWIITASYRYNDDLIAGSEYNFILHPKAHWFWGLYVTDYTTGNIVRHWYADGGGLDSGIVCFDATADGMKVIGKAAPETFDANGDGIENPYVYIFNLATGTVQKANWGLEGDSDIEIVDSMNRVYCTLPNQQALVWFPLP